jgi:hypothetical protein
MFQRFVQCSVEAVLPFWLETANPGVALHLNRRLWPFTALVDSEGDSSVLSLLFN